MERYEEPSAWERLDDDIKSEIEREFQDFWMPIVNDGQGGVDLNLVKIELFDYSNSISSVSTVYSSITGGMISKPNTTPEAVLGVVAERDEERDKERAEDIIEYVQDNLQGHVSGDILDELVGIIRDA